jgi:iron complex outermembrane receptor protein
VLTVLPAYRHSSMQYSGQFGFLLEEGYGIGNIPPKPQTSSATSLEIRLAGDTNRLKWVTGFYFANEDQFEEYAINGGYLQSVAPIANYGTKSLAGFAQATYAVVEHFRLIGGVRYTTDQRSLTNGQTYIVTPAAFLGPPPPQAVACALGVQTQPQCLVDSYAGQKTFDNISWKGWFEADVLSNSLFYATASRGFKAGGFNTQSAAGEPGQALSYSPETLTSYETGLKSRFLDNRLQVNVSGYYWDYKNHQEPTLTYTNVPGVTNLIYENAGASTIYGGDLDIVARPWQGGTIETSVEYAHSFYNSFDVSIPTFSYSPAAKACPVTSQNPVTTTLSCAGFQVSRVPAWSGNLGLTQDIELARGKLIANGLLTFASGRWLGTDFIPIERAKSYTKLDAQLTYQPPSARWSITAFIRNITDARIYTDGARDPFSPLVYADIQPPRSYGGRLSYNF